MERRRIVWCVVAASVLSAGLCWLFFLTLRFPPAEENRTTDSPDVARSDGESLSSEPESRRAQPDSRAETETEVISGWVRDAQGQPVAGDRTVRVAAADVSDVVVVLTKKEEGGFVRGRVTDEAGQPVAGTRILAVGAGLRHRSASTDADGRYELAHLGTVDAVELHVQHPDYSRALRKDVPANSEQVDFRLVSRVTAAGRVVDAVTRQPLQWFEVRGVPCGEGRFERASDWAEFVADDGIWNLTAVEPGRVRFEARAPGYAVASTEPVLLSAGTAAQVFEVRLLRAAKIEGIVVDRTTGVGIAGARVRLHNESTFSPVLLVDHATDGTALARADAEGRFSLLSDSSPPSRAIVWSDGYAVGTFEGIPTDRTARPLRLGLDPEAILTISVRKNDESVPEVTIDVRQYNPAGSVAFFAVARTKPDGAAELRGLPPGRFEIVLEDADRRRLGVIRKTLNAGVSASEDIDLGKLAARMAEVLVTPEAIDGKARYVSLSKVDEPGVRYSSIPDEIGNCQLTGIPPGDYRLEAQLVDGQLSVLADVLRLTAGERRTVNSVISATPAQR